MTGDARNTKPCAVCGATFDKSDTLRKHRRRAHVVEANVTLGEYNIAVPFLSGSFTCPLMICRRPCVNIDTFSKHMMDQHQEEVSVLATETKRSEKRPFHEETEDFNFGRGTERALRGHDVKKARHLVADIGCEPVALHLSHDTIQEDLCFVGLFETNAVKSMANTLPFKSETRSLNLDAVVQLHKEQATVTTVSPSISATRQSIALVKDIRLSSLPGLIGNCNYHEPGQDLITMLNFDFRLAPSLLHAVAKLHTGALVYSERETALLLTCEAYSRSKATDVHSETSMKSIPKDGESIFVGICQESDGGGPKQKLKIGGKHMNVLSTMSAIIGHDLFVNIGLETKMADAKYTIFYPEENVKVYKAAMEQATNYIVTPDVNAIRQLVSGFGDTSTYKPYRASLESIVNHETTMPATVFNLCNLPHNGNYGVSDAAAPKIASRFLNTIAAAYLMNRYTVPKAQFEEVLQFYNAHKTQKSQQWRVLSTFVEALEAELQKSQKIDILSFGRANVGPLAAMINQALSTANKQIKVNVAQQLTRVYGHTNKK